MCSATKVFLLTLLFSDILQVGTPVRLKREFINEAMVSTINRLLLLIMLQGPNANWRNWDNLMARSEKKSRLNGRL